MRRGRLAIVVVWLAWQVLAAHALVPTWGSDLALWTRAHAVNPSSGRAELNLAKARYLR